MRIAAVLIAVFLAGCQTDSTSTASGSPETTIRGVKTAQVRSAIINAAMNRGMRLKAENTYQITFERPWGGEASSLLLGAAISSGGSAVRERLVFALADVPDGTRVVLDRYMVKAGAFGREEESHANNGLGLENLQLVLESVIPR